ncbi:MULTISPECIES: RNA polymerase sigma factor [Hyphobacterium]|jgi:RNA polymerase sigma factor (sigma-70 family)|uniref:RNA polymerase sigma factor n=1 Tax=Hyphobacterium vulgare TaxID=1736751 RepID=A0ABV6ZW44_9PROT|nr:RNA polymerase sigma factor [Hyphobacterium sp. SN044]MBI1234368.1 sigma-70 family RNA polymerase sigma factor [Alphaproteobacteria bacterium]MCF8881002.1 RNA polymerase sigma factor [Hyphobacterium sp. SN044]
MPGIDANPGQNKIDDARLAVRAAEGDDLAFNRIMQRHGPAIFRFLYRMLRDAGDAEDAAQETFVAAHRNLFRYDPERPLLAWLFRIARNKARDHVRRQVVRRWLTAETGNDRYPAQDPSPERVVEDRDDLAALESAIARLPEGLRTPLLLSAVEDLPHSEIAEIMGLSVKGVEMRIYRARKKIAALSGLRPEG